MKKKLVKCPHCEKEIIMKRTAVFAEEQKITTTLTSKTEIMPAKVLGDHINAMQKLLKEIGKSLGGKVEVFITDMKKQGQKYTVEFLTLEVKPKK